MKMNVEIENKIKGGSIVYVWGDFYKTTGFWKESELIDREVKEWIKQKFDINVDVSELAQTISNYFNFKERYSKKEIEEVKRKLESEGFAVDVGFVNDARGRFYYVSEVAWNDLQTFENLIKKVLQAEIEKRQEEKRKIEELKQKARETGQLQEFRSYTVPCSSLSEECNVDIVVEYVNGQGEIVRKQFHTW